MNELKKQNHFEKFSLPIAFDLDAENLEQKYLQFQMQFHPDKSDLQDVENSVIINEAYEILKDPVKRGSYILKLNGIDIEKDPSNIKPDLQLLSKILEFQEQIAEIKDLQEIKNLQKKINDELTGLLKEIRNLLDEKSWNKAALSLIEAKYLKKSLKDLKEKSKN